MRPNRFLVFALLLAAAAPLVFSAGTSEPAAELEFLMVGNADGMKDTALVEAALNKVTAAKIGATVKLTYYGWGDYTNKLNLRFASRDDFELCFQASFAGNYANNVAKGLLADITDLLKQHGKDILKTTRPDYLAYVTYSGKVRAIPNEVVTFQKPDFTVRKDLLDKYGYRGKIKSFETLQPFLEAVKKGEPETIPFLYETVGISTTFEVHKELYGLRGLTDYGVPGSVYLAAPRKAVDQYETPEYQKFTRMLREWYQKGLVASDAHLKYPEDADVMAGRFSAAGNFQNTSVNIPSMNAGRKYPVEIVPIDSPKYSAKPVWLTGLNVNAANPVKAIRLMNLFRTDAALFATVVYGVEGTHWKKNADASFTPLEAASRYPAGLLTAFQTGNISLLPSPADFPDMYARVKKENADVIPNPTAGFTFDSEPVKEQVVACTNVIKELGVPLSAGAVDFDSGYPAFIQKLKAAGVDALIAELQRQLDAWWARK